MDQLPDEVLELGEERKQEKYEETAEVHTLRTKNRLLQTKVKMMTRERAEMRKELLDCQTELNGHSKHRGAVEIEYRRQENLLLENIETAEEKVKCLENHIKYLETENCKITTFNDRLSEIFCRHEPNMESSLRGEIQSCVDDN